MRSRIRTILIALLLVPVPVFAEKPAGWFLAGSEPASYTIERDVTVTHGSKASGRLSSIGKPKGFGTMMQSFDAADYLGKRLKLSAYVKTRDVASWAGMWMRVDGPEPGRSLAFDNMQNRPIKGTWSWTPYSIVLDVAPNAKDIAFGVLVDGAGTVWLDDVRFEVVDKTVPTTGTSELKPRPENLDFEH